MSHFKMVNYHFDPVFLESQQQIYSTPMEQQSAYIIYIYIVFLKDTDVELTAVSTPYKMNPPTPK